MSPWVTEVELTVISTAASWAVTKAHSAHMKHALKHARNVGKGTSECRVMTYQSFSMVFELPLPRCLA